MKTLKQLIADLSEGNFDERQMNYMFVQTAQFYVQLIDKETGEIDLHKLDFESKEKLPDFKPLFEEIKK